MAQFEAKLLAAILLQKFRFSLLRGEEEKITYGLAITLILQNGKGSNKLLMIPERRKTSEAE